MLAAGGKPVKDNSATAFSFAAVQVVLRNVIVEFEVIEQRFGTSVLPHHDQQASEDQDHAVHGTNASLYRTSPAYQSDFFNTHACYRQSY
jgi:hypothetical protein